MIGIFRDNLIQLCCQVVRPSFFFSLKQTSFLVSVLNLNITLNHGISLIRSPSATGVWILVMRVTDIFKKERENKEGLREQLEL